MGLNYIPVPAGIPENTLAGSQVQEIVTTYNMESLQAVNAPVSKNALWAMQGTKTTGGVGLVKVPVRFLSSQTMDPFEFGGQRKYGTVDVGVTQVTTSPWQRNYRWAMVEDELGKLKLMSVGGDGTYNDFYGATGLAQAIVNAGQVHRALLVATAIASSWTDATSGLTASVNCFDGLPLFTNGVDSAKHKANPNNPNSDTFETLFRPGVANRVGFTGGAFGADWLGKMVQAMTQVPHPSLPNSTMELEVTDIVGPTWMKVPFWQTAVSSLQLQTATIGTTGVGAATTNIFNAEILKNMGAEKFIGSAGVHPQTFWTTSMFDSLPYALANKTTGPNGGPAHFCMAIANMRPREQTWCELASNSVDFTPRVKLYGPGDPTAESERMVRMLGDLDAGAAPSLPHFVMMFCGV
ncbi:MAG TPA: hypothetical protein VLT47_10865 [Anaeromyxobacteraceae bacterium]|nr:hypothetical protein [Anaeromyxobacteraceae bacterium]